MKPNLVAYNAALEGCCCDLGSVSDAENVVETMSVLGVRPDEASFGFLAYLSIGFGIVNACVNLGLLDKAHSILDQMTAEVGFVGLGVYALILKAYCKEQRTSEAAQLIMDINTSGLGLDAASYGALIEASMSNQDFQSAFTLFREMREAKIPDMQMSYF
ncbi:Pentatricopeptide repeat-containing protein [Thalictrum thalictroides]|uniref:Pentatricopeptide repeat-containing protein n=1 Tax=Thalictrum thalictroides TaxID=46969 RepID=A0A7J6VTF7_THATH|nr:Pentatricopeptide repeat-containing protein [Thalictrum thalictroides]